MKNFSRTTAGGLLALLVYASSAGAVYSADALFGITFTSNNLVTVDQNTGAATVVGSLGETSSPYGIAAKGDRLYTFDQTTNRIREINKTSGRYGRTIDIGVTGLKGEGDLAFRDSDGVGFLASALNANNEPTNDFYTFTIADNADTGVAIRLGTTGVPIDALAFSSNGTLYGIGQTNATLYTIDTTSGVATAVGSLGISAQSPVAGMAFSSDDNLYAAIDDRLYRINTTTGAASTISPVVLNFSPLISSVSGLTFAPGTGALGNISTRASVGTGDRVAIVGVIVRGTPDKTVVVRGLGPSLTTVPNRLADPVLDLFNSQGQMIATNDDFGSSADKQAITDFGLAPTNPKESAILRSLPEGAYTAILRGANQGTGVGLVEVYDTNNGSGSRVVNLSTRGFVDVGDNALIGGVIVQGSGLQRVVLRAIGPSLTNRGVVNALTDPNLSIYDVNGTLIKFNDNYTMDPEVTEIVTRGLAPSDNRESATIVNLVPGAYTAIVRGANNTSGIALIENYNITN